MKEAEYYGYTEKEVIAMIYAEPKLNGVSEFDWHTFAKALHESKYTKEVKVMYAGKLPIFIFPRDRKPRINSHLFSESNIESGGSLFKKAEEHFTAKELKLGDICVIYDEKRLTSRDM